MPPQVEANKTVVRDFIEQCWNQGNLDAIDEYIAPDCRWRSGGPLGPEVWKRAMTAWHTGLPDFTYHVQQLVAEDDMVIAIVTFTATHQGVLQDIPAGFGNLEPTGKRVDVREVLVYRLADGRVVQFTDLWDKLGFLQQLGISSALT